MQGPFSFYLFISSSFSLHIYTFLLKLFFYVARCEGRLTKQKEHSPAISSTAAQKERKKKKHTRTHGTAFSVLSFSLFFFSLWQFIIR